jgi:26S proteasome regulatory subunit N8
MIKKVNSREKVVGWYSTGPLIRPSDLEVNELMRRYTPEPILCIIDVNPKDNLEIPTQAYISVENAPEAQAVTRRTFAHIPSEIGAEEAEEVGVEHLLRNIHDTSQSTLTDQVQSKLASLRSLRNRMLDICKYLDNVINGKCPPNHQIIYNIQDVLNLCPDLQSKEMSDSLAITNNDNMLVIYLSSLIRSILALDDLINNKLRNQALETEELEDGDKKDDKNEKKDEKDKKDGEKDKKDGEKKKEEK